MPTKPTDEASGKNPAPAPGRLRPLPLLLALGVALLVSLWPSFLVDAQGHPDHATALLLCLAVSAGAVSGFGFVPRFWLWRAVFSQWTSLALFAWAGARLGGLLG